jgi:hypothetical protein
VLIFAGVVLLLIVAASSLAPPSDDSDKRPTTYNSGSGGIKAAYLTLGELGFSTARWEQPASSLDSVDAAHTTIIYTAPVVPHDKLEETRSDISAFLKRGGRVLVTGPYGTHILPLEETAASTQTFQTLCLTTPEGRSPLARAGKVSISDSGRWAAMTPEVHVEQWCGGDAVVVSYRVGAGTAIWWSSAVPLTNRGLKDDASLKLLLASVQDPSQARTQVLFDEYFHSVQTSLFDLTRGLPLKQIGWQSAAVAVLLVLSFGRRNGPMRIPVRLPRTSPIEFAESMGQLYRKAGATQAATEGARHRLLRFLVERCGVPRAAIQADPAAIADALQARFSGDWSGLAQHLTQATEARFQTLAPRNALALVQALDGDLTTLTERLNRSTRP